MAVLIRMPLLSDTMEEGNVLSWLKKVGDKVKVGDVLAQVETDKATMDLESYEEGVLLHIEKKQGKVAVDGILGVIGQVGEDFQSLLSQTGSSNTASQTDMPISDSTSSVEAPEGLIPIRMPLLSDTMVEGKVVAWKKQIGDKVKDDDILAEVETDKATMELQAYAEGELLYQATQVGGSIKVNDLLAIVGPVGTKVNPALINQLFPSSDSSSSQSTESPSSKSSSLTTVSTTNSSSTIVNTSHANTRIKASPLAKKLAKERGLDLQKIVGSGDDGRIIKRDIELCKGEFKSVLPPSSSTQDIIVPVNQMRSVIAKRLLKSKQEAPHFCVSVRVEMSNIIAARKLLNTDKSRGKISINDMVLKATALALRVHPEMNSSWRGDHIVRYVNVNVAVALATDDGGLLVPVIRNTDQKSLAQISAEVKEFALKAKEKRLQPADWADNTFTVSNLGMFGVDNFSAIINPPDVAILAVGGIIEQPVVSKGQIVVGQVMNLTVSADHRAVDGVIVAKFLNTLKSYLEEPVLML